MTHTEQAIIDARQNGWWIPAQEKFHYRLDTGEFCEAALYSVFLDPAFWQALGKARGWSSFACSDCYQRSGFTFDSCIKCLGERVRVEMETWKVEWHRFIDHRAEGKDAESFFVGLE